MNNSGKKKCGLIGNPLGHSWSPEIHAALGCDYEYRLFPLEEEEVAPFLAAREFDGLNVTIPYKKTVMPYLDRISDEARRIGSVNTIVKDADGKLGGYNTDYFGFSFMLDRRGITLAGKKVVILGSGGASVTARTVAEDRGAARIVVISRSGEDNYTNLGRHADAGILINTTPVGMYPKNGESPVDLDRFPALEAVVDMIYNPERTALAEDALEREIPVTTGLPMLVAQAGAAAELFTGQPVGIDALRRALTAVAGSKRNLVLVGMPGCGKSTAGRLFAERTGRQFVDTDHEIVRAAGKSIPDIFAMDGEAAFRDLETKVLAEWTKQSSLVIATGGGAVIRGENRRLMRQNGVVLLLTRPLDKLAKDGRPLSQTNSAEALWEARKGFYRAAADGEIPVEDDPTGTVDRIARWWETR